MYVFFLIRSCETCRDLGTRMGPTLSSCTCQDIKFVGRLQSAKLYLSLYQASFIMQKGNCISMELILIYWWQWIQIFGEVTSNENKLKKNKTVLKLHTLYSYTEKMTTVEYRDFLNAVNQFADKDNRCWYEFTICKKTNKLCKSINCFWNEKLSESAL